MAFVDNRDMKHYFIDKNSRKFVVENANKKILTIPY